MGFVPIKNYEGLYEINSQGVVRSIDRVLKVKNQSDRLFKGRLLATTTNTQIGYLTVSLWKNNTGKTLHVHRLVAEAFIPNPLNKPEVNHIDADKTNANVRNLEWCTREENIQHAYNIGTMTQVHRKNLTDLELEHLLQEFLNGLSLTQLASELAIGLSRLSINMRRRAIEVGLIVEYEQELSNQKKLRNSNANQPKTTQVLQYSKEGIFIASHTSLNKAGKATGTSAGNICNVLAGRTKTAGGFLWKLP